jgi:hypothetical protein
MTMKTALEKIQETIKFHEDSIYEDYCEKNLTLKIISEALEKEETMLTTAENDRHYICEIGRLFWGDDKQCYAADAVYHMVQSLINKQGKYTVEVEIPEPNINRNNEKECSRFCPFYFSERHDTWRNGACTKDWGNLGIMGTTLHPGPQCPRYKGEEK